MLRARGLVDSYGTPPHLHKVSSLIRRNNMSLHTSTPKMPAKGHEGIDERFEVIAQSSINKNRTLKKKKKTALE